MKKLLKKSCGSWDKQGFTLVELIIVIAIIAVLAVSAFMMLTKWLGNSRDSRRIADANTIQSALNIHMGDLDNSAGLLPLPSNSVELSASGTVIGYQGNFDASVIEQMDNLQKVPLDPDENYYTYYVSEDRKKFQILVYLENDNELVGNIYNMAKAEYEGRYEKSFGYDLGVFTDTNNVPVQNLGLTGIDLTTTSESYNVVYKDDKVEDATGIEALSSIIIVQDKQELIDLDSSLVGRWDMETTEGGLLKDFGSYGMNGTLLGDIQIGGVDGVDGKATYFDGLDDRINLGNFFDGEIDSFSVSLFVKLDQVNQKTCPAGDPNKFTPFLSSRNTYAGKVDDWGFRYGIVKNCNNETNWHFSVLGGNKGISGRLGPLEYENFVSEYIDNKWDHIVVTFDNGEISFYMNGNLMDKRKESSFSMFDGRDYLFMGFTGVNSGYLKGILDEVRIYDRVLTSSEAKALGN